MASLKSVKHLVAAGANLKKQAGYGIVPLELALSNLRADHLRGLQKVFWK